MVPSLGQASGNPSGLRRRRLWQEVQRRLRQEFEQPLVKPAGTMQRMWRTLSGQPNIHQLIQRRAVAAEALARIESGNPGTQPAFWRPPYGEPVWAEVPAGKFWMGSDEITDGEKPLHQVQLDTFYIAKVPVTNAQYYLYVEDTGHETPPRWEDGRPVKGQESHPVVNVSWHDALAYCRWLSEKTGRDIRLPTEEQWEKAARGDQDQRTYPWGDEWDAARCNNSEFYLQTTPVGIFPDGVSPFGCYDMSGNVWEWTISLWGKDWQKPDFKYPYNPDDGHKDLTTGDDSLRVMRGGSFRYNHFWVSCVYRDKSDPLGRNGEYGFRVIRAFPFTPSES